MKIAVTGANGYIGTALIRRCLQLGFEVVACSRRPPANDGSEVLSNFTGHCTASGIPDVSMLAGCDTIVHLAGRAHNFNAPDADAALFEWSNHQLAIAVANAALKAGATRFIQVSTVSVHGNWSEQPITESSPLRATNPYAQSKLAAEESLHRLCDSSGMQLCVVRPPLVFGPACPGNFFRLVRLVRSGWPLPLQSVSATRSFIHVENLVDFLRHCITTGSDDLHSCFVIGDGSDWLMPDLARAIATQLDLKPRLLRCNPGLLRLAATLLGRRREIDSMTRSLVVDWSLARETRWLPALPPDIAFRQTMAYYRESSP